MIKILGEVEYFLGYNRLLNTKRNISFLVMLFFTFSSFSQYVQEDGSVLYGDEWIASGQEYYSFNLAEDGIYRIGYNELLEAGIPVNTIVSTQYQLFRIGNEQAIHVSSSSSTLQTGDYIEFYGRAMSEEFHNTLYENFESDQLNPYFNLITDTVCYFLTWSNITGKRYQEVISTINPNLDTLDYIFNTIGEYQSKAINKTYDVDNSSFPSHFRNHDGHFLYATKNKTINNIGLPGLKEDLKIGGVLRLRVKNRKNELPFGLIWNTDTVHFQTLVIDELLDVSVTLDSLSASSNNLIIRDLNIKSNFNLVYYFIDYPQIFDSEYSVINTENADLTNNYSFSIEQNTSNVLIYSSDSDDVILAQANSSNEVVVDMSIFNGDKGIAINYGDHSLYTISNFKKARFFEDQTKDFEYLMLSTRSIPDLENELLSYKEYRESELGGNYTADIVFYEDILNSFGYGIPRNFLSIKSFINSLESQEKEPEDLFIIGKGRSLKDWRIPEDINNELFSKAFIPTYGYHGSDFLLITKGHNVLDPICNIGRLPITRADQLSDYLNKVMQLDSFRYIKNVRAEDIFWMNDVLHLGGGSSVGPLIKNYLERMQDTIEQSSWDAGVTSFYKTGSEVIQNAQSEALNNIINDGLGILTFFGHSSTGSFDFKLEDPSTYRSNGKYSVMFSFGCLNGDIHSVIYGIAEQFVLEPNAGSIAYLGSTGFGFLSALRRMGLEQYEILANRHTIRLGELNKIAIANLSTVNGTGLVELREQNVLVGDPVIELGPIKGKDYTISYSSVKTKDAIISLQNDSFDVDFIVYNLGELSKDEITIHYEIMQNGIWYNLGYDIINIESVNELISKRLNIPSSLLEGTASFHITIDPNDDIVESPLPKAESNNRLGFSRAEEGFRLIFSKSKASILSPRDFAIVTDENPQIVFQTDRLFSESTIYICQIDTVASFDSGAFLMESIQSSGGAIKWSPEHSWDYDKVYYIRVSIDKRNGVDFNWDTRSFVYRFNDREGWNQSHIDQFKTMVLEDVHIDSVDNFSFSSYNIAYYIRNFFIRNTNGGGTTIHQGNSLVWGTFAPRGIVLVVIDDTTFEPVPNLDRDYGSSGGIHFYWTNPDTLKRRQIMEFMDEQVKEGQYVIFMPVRKANDTVNYRVEDWAMDSTLYGRNLFQMLEDEGANDIRSMEESPRPYVFIYRKGYGKIREESTYDLFDEVKFTLNFEVPIDSGSMTTLDIGPAKEFYEVVSNYSDKETADIIDLRISGFKNTIDTTTLELVSVAQDFEFDLNMTGIDSMDYLNLMFTHNDTSSNTIPQLQNVRVYYESFPEFYYVSSDSVFWDKSLVKGEMQTISYYLGNFSAFTSDSLLVKYTLMDEMNQEVIWTEKYQDFDRYEETKFELNIETWNLEGNYQLLIELNPDFHQKELVSANNYAQLQFEVQRDNEKPILSILFDGSVMQFNGFVSSNPTIDIELRDLNSGIFLNDTTRLKVYLKIPEAPNFTEVFYSEEDLIFIESLEFGLAKAQYLPNLIKEGIYSLMVLANDGNEFNKIIYEVDFQYENDPLFSNVELYPNPAVSESYFSFFLEGTEIPDRLNFQIWNSLGQKISNIDLTNSFEIKLGNNELLLNFKDRSIFGSTFPTGSYRYQIKALDVNGQDYNAGGPSSEYNGQFILIK